MALKLTGKGANGSSAGSQAVVKLGQAVVRPRSLADSLITGTRPSTNTDGEKKPRAPRAKPPKGSYY